MYRGSTTNRPVAWYRVCQCHSNPETPRNKPKPVTVGLLVNTYTLNGVKRFAVGPNSCSGESICIAQITPNLSVLVVRVTSTVEDEQVTVWRWTTSGRGTYWLRRGYVCIPGETRRTKRRNLSSLKPAKSWSVRRLSLNPLEFRGYHSATSNNIKLVHWPSMGGLFL